MVKKRKAKAPTVKEIAKDIKKKIVVNKKVLRQGPRSVLDIRRRPEREVPVKQWAFKEDSIKDINQ